MNNNLESQIISEIKEFFGKQNDIGELVEIDTCDIPRTEKEKFFLEDSARILKGLLKKDQKECYFDCIFTPGKLILNMKEFLKDALFQVECYWSAKCQKNLNEN